MIDKQQAENIASRLRTVEASLSAPGAAADQKRYREMVREHASLRKLSGLLSAYLKLNASLEDARRIADDPDADDDFRELARAEAVRMLDRVRIPDAATRLQTWPHQYSGGMRQRTMIAMALACQPKLIIADEPTTALDVTVQAQILDLLKDLTQKAQTSMILITHDMGVVARYADRVAVMYGGRIVEQGPAREIFSRPAHPYTQGLLASIPRLDSPRGEPLRPIPGTPRDTVSWAKACAFAPRCGFSEARCLGAVPLLRALGPQHRSACWRDAHE